MITSAISSRKKTDAFVWLAVLNSSKIIDASKLNEKLDHVIPVLEVKPTHKCKKKILYPLFALAIFRIINSLDPRSLLKNSFSSVDVLCNS